MKVTQTSTTSTDAPRVPLGPRPAFPAQAAPVKHLPHDLPRIPTARTAAGSYTRESLDDAIKADASDNDRVIPKFPGQRRSPEQPTPKIPGQRSSIYNDIVLGDRYDENFANGAF